ncbi:protein of unknown function [Paraburkholderia dioscoreae]|uniref:Uncharacterized protein n=1 Tax=Paraburkholderia dioscoreae TaxID=2604047 RepID=A0A5Q4ZPH5_9BURK|nr:protein of unknown function [Paraburkholderia dioscoreae]
MDDNHGFAKYEHWLDPYGREART